MIDKNYFLTRLENGENIDAIGQNVADMMNEALEEYTAKQAAEEQANQLANAKRELMRKEIDFLYDYIRLVDPELAKHLEEVSDEDITMLVKSLDAMLKLANTTVNLTIPTNQFEKPCTKAPLSDDEILSKFIKNFL